MKEHWKPVVGFEQQYEVSDQMRVRDRCTGRILTAKSNGFVQLRVAVGKRTDRSVRRLYAEAFEGAGAHRRQQLTSGLPEHVEAASQAPIAGETWRAVVGWEGLYEVSDHGRVRRVTASHKSPAGHILTPGDCNGYRNVVLYRDGKRTTCNVHLLVAHAFLGPPPSPKHEVNHKDGKRARNLCSNLEWVTRSRNKRHGFEIGISRKPTGELNTMAKLTESDVREIRKLWAQRPGKRLPPDHPLSQAVLAKRFGVTGPSLSDIVHRRTWQHLVE